jgi:F0F1-type ATP synthase membrane subunit b/b'
MNYEQIATWSQVISAVVFMAVLVWLWFRFLQPAVLAAQKANNRQIAEAERHRDEARAALDALQAEIEGARRDAEAIRRRAGDQALHEREAALAQAIEAGERALRGAAGELDRARSAARGRLRVELLERALRLARSGAEKRVDARLNRQLVDRFAATLERRGG